MNSEKVYGCSKLQKIVSEVLDFCKILKMHKQFSELFFNLTDIEPVCLFWDPENFFVATHMTVKIKKNLPGKKFHDLLFIANGPI